MNLLEAVLASALVSAIISSLLTLWGQYLERKSRKDEQRLERDWQRKELILTKAVDLALARTQFVKEVAKETNRKALLVDSVILANSYYKDFESLLDTGEIQEETNKRSKESLKKAKEAEETK